VSEVKGMRLHVRYALPCADEKLVTKKLSEEEYQAFLTYAQGNTEYLNLPRFEEVFSDLKEELGKFADELKLPLYGDETIELYWRFCHGNIGEPCLHWAMVWNVVNPLKITLLLGGRLVSGLNIYQHTLSPKDIVSVHYSCVIELLHRDS
jgi:hypothetical protein